MVQPQSELIRVLAHNLCRGKEIGSTVGFGKELQQGQGKWIGGTYRKLIVGIGLVEEDIEKLVVLIVTKTASEEISVPEFSV